MNRTGWTVALLVGLVSAGVAGAQPAERVVMLRQASGLPESCRRKKAWTTDDGRKAWLLQSLGSDMLLTVVEKARNSPGGAPVGVTIYPWGNDAAPPPGSPVPPPDGDILLATHTTEAPAPRRPTVTAVSASLPAPTTVVAPAAGCAPVACDHVHHYETPPALHFVAGGCLPVCSPEHSATYGYYPTQWRPYPGGAEIVLPAPPEPTPMPKVTLP